MHCCSIHSPVRASRRGVAWLVAGAFACLADPTAWAADGTLNFKDSTVVAGRNVSGRVFDSSYWGAPGSRSPVYALYITTPLDQSGTYPVELDCVKLTDKDGQPVAVVGHGAWNRSTDPSPWASFSFISAANLPPLYYRVQLASDPSCTQHLTDFDVLQIVGAAPEEQPIQEKDNRWSATTVDRPKVGSYTIFENYQRRGNGAIDYVGLTRIEVEANEPGSGCAAFAPHLSDRVSWRMTKTSSYSYWAASPLDGPSPAATSQLRFCASPRGISSAAGVADRSFLSATGGTQYVGTRDFENELSAVRVEYDDAHASPYPAAAALGGFPIATPCGPNRTTRCRINYDFDMGTNYDRSLVDHDLLEGRAYNAAFYSLLPSASPNPANPTAYRVPLLGPAYSNINATGLTLIEQEFSARPALTNPDIRWTGVWHTEAFEPNEDTLLPPGSSRPPLGSPAALRMRYVEYGRYIVTEDWVWRANGLVSRISQWWPTVKRCWKDPSDTACTQNTAVPHNDAIAVEMFVPRNVAGMADLSLAPPDITTTSWAMRLKQRFMDNGVLCTTANCQNYSGFVEIKLDGVSQGLWRDCRNRPIYVHRGMVRVPWRTVAWSLGTHQISVRPYFTRVDVDSFSPLPNAPANLNVGGWTQTQSLPVSVPTTCTP